MRVLTCFLPPTAGQAPRGRLRRARAADGGQEADRLPAGNAAALPGNGGRRIPDLRRQAEGHPGPDLARRVDEASERCAIGDVRTKLIGKLSKGYRQRVGLAQAIIHNPDVLILDEPTAGLDPKQIIETRTLIKGPGRRPHHHPQHPHPAGSGADLRAGGHHQQGQAGGDGTVDNLTNRLRGAEAVRGRSGRPGRRARPCRRSCTASKQVPRRQPRGVPRDQGTAVTFSKSRACRDARCGADVARAVVDSGLEPERAAAGLGQPGRDLPQLTATAHRGGCRRARKESSNEKHLVTSAAKSCESYFASPIAYGLMAFFALIFGLLLLCLHGDVRALRASSPR